MNKPSLVLLVGAPGSGKSTFSYDLTDTHFRVSQDDSGKEHLNKFHSLIKEGKNICVDRMGFNKQQRERYLKPAREAGYFTQIITLFVPREECLRRCIERNKLGNHPTIRTLESAQSALNTFFTKFEFPTQDEADTIESRYWEAPLKTNAIICDIDNTLSSANHRQHHVQGTRKNWPAFFDGMEEDPLNKFCKDIIVGLRTNHTIVLCSGRPDNYEKHTRRWLEKHRVPFDHLFMRNRHDSRKDDLIKEIILHFELLPRFHINFALDDRNQVVDMLRRNGIRTLQVAYGDF